MPYPIDNIDKKSTSKPFRTLSKKESKSIAALVKISCANYSSHYGICLPLDTICPMMGKYYWNHGVCKYFNEYVLPDNLDLQLKLTGSAGNEIPCKICGVLFLPVGKQYYCSDSCRKTAKKYSNKICARKARQKVKK